ncbi:uncharacterized protein [Physcomitrium patens]|uniref:Pyrrolidone-carboxylate peptidase n=1 Tax=Physcomitrium patens TaxID=3218 RepID=A0A2K1IFP4_PHYPA|nr:uncharacterized protein LOC112276335 isoform X1 [Physcomitrium patens]PNR28096.1 hypothetical protein PHYPA_028688 [Physcomitrium patens]|eukprot:XP_024363330.1 uncharacterized protein LOC112276335 isoform X1 [Physcomitrella patens]
MGSEASELIEFHITGFRKFHLVPENPTEILVGKIEEYSRKHGMAPGTQLGSCTVLETAGKGALDPLLQLLSSSHEEIEKPLIMSAGASGDVKLGGGSLSVPPKRIVWVHLGVNIASNNFSVERRAVNEATFGCSDELGWQPQRVPIVPEDGPTSFIRETTLPIRDIVSALSKEGFNVMESYDAGRFVCNYVYYHSLRHAQVSGVKSLFVHVPSFHFINQECQLEFIAALLKVLAMFC